MAKMRSISAVVRSVTREKVSHAIESCIVIGSGEFRCKR